MRVRVKMKMRHARIMPRGVARVRKCIPSKVNNSRKPYKVRNARTRLSQFGDESTKSRFSQNYSVLRFPEFYLTQPQIRLDFFEPLTY